MEMSKAKDKKLIAFIETVHSVFDNFSAIQEFGRNKF